jgi:1,2-diacylglycerol 3-beta-galactosyltransferase
MNGSPLSFDSDLHLSFFFFRVKQAFLMYRPDLIVSVHPLCQTLPLRILKDMGIRERIPFVTVVTDLGSAHPLWFHKDVCSNNESM